MATADLRSDIIFFSDHQKLSTVDYPEAMRLAVMQKTPEERSEFFSQAFVNVSSFDAGLRFIHALLERAKHTKQAGGLWIVGDGGTGKSFILDRIHQQYAPIETPVSRIVPLISIELRERPSVSSLMLHMLYQLGQDLELLHYRNNDDLEDALVAAMVTSKTLAVMFDEAQHLWISNTRKKDRAAGQVGDFLKRLYRHVGAAYIFAGTPGLGEVADRECQSNTRWSGRLTLKNFEYDIDFLGLVDALDELAPMPQKAGLKDPLIAAPLHLATQGNFRLLKRLLAEAVLIAARERSERITLSHLSDAHFNIFCDISNPFLKK